MPARRSLGLTAGLVLGLLLALAPAAAAQVPQLPAPQRCDARQFPFPMMIIDGKRLRRGDVRYVMMRLNPRAFAGPGDRRNPANPVDVRPILVTVRGRTHRITRPPQQQIPVRVRRGQRVRATARYVEQRAQYSASVHVPALDFLTGILGQTNLQIDPQSNLLDQAGSLIGPVGSVINQVNTTLADPVRFASDIVTLPGPFLLDRCTRAVSTTMVGPRRR